MRAIYRQFRAFTTVALVSLFSACSSGDDDGGGGTTNPPPVTTGSLTVTIAGLPGGTAAAVTVTGPSGFSRSVTATTTLADLAPGGYTISATSVTATNGRYAPTSATQSVTVVASSTPAAVTVTYGLATGSLTITVSGLPAGVNGAVTVTGPNQFTRAVTATTTITGLDAGLYTVTAAEVNTNNDRYVASAPTQSVSVTAGATANASVSYALTSGQLTITVTGLPAAVNAAVTVTGPGGYNRTVTATTVLSGLTAGAYTVAAANVVGGGVTYRPTPTSQTVSISVTAPASASISYAASEGTLTITVTGLPQGANAGINVAGPAGFSQIVNVTTTLGPLQPGSYVISASSVNFGAQTYTPTPLNQTATVVAGAGAAATVTYAAPVGLRLTQVIVGMSRPVHLVAPAGDARLFVVEQTGRIRIIQNGQLLAQPFLDLSTRILAVTDDDDEHGLLGLAFHPQYASNGLFFVFYMDPIQDIVVERYQVSSNANVASTTGTVVLRVPHGFGKSHNGGGLVFGPEGFLYIGIGDGGCCADPLGTGQNLNTLLGKVLRIDVSTTPYTTPTSNPFVGQAGRRGEIWAYGLRNPWRIDIDAASSMLYVADVGEDNLEEVNAVPLSLAGPNFGWSIMEGTQCFRTACSTAGLRLPVIEYSHGGGCSITGGFVYRGTQIPELAGHYFYSDYCQGFLRSFLLANGLVTSHKDWPIAPPGFVTSFGKDGSGELYMLTQAGGIYKIVRQ